MASTTRGKYNLRERKPNATPTSAKISSPKDTVPKRIASERIASKKAAKMVVSPSSTEKGEYEEEEGEEEEEEIAPKRKLPESDFEDDGKDDGGGDDGSGLVRTKKRKVTAAQSVTVAKRVTADRKIPKGQGVDFDITIGRKYQAEPCVHTPHISEERLQEIFAKIRNSIREGVAEQTITVRPWNYILPTKAQISRRKQQGLLLYTDIGCTKIAATKTKTTPILRAPALIALERERQVAKLRSTRVSVASKASKITETRGGFTPSTPKNKGGEQAEDEEEDEEGQGGEDEEEDEEEGGSDDDEEEDDKDDENEAEACSLSVYSPYWSTHKKRTEEEDDDYVPSSRSNRISFNTRQKIKGDKTNSSPSPHISLFKPQPKKPGSRSAGAQAKSSEDHPSALGESSPKAQDTSMNAESREERPVIDYSHTTTISGTSSSANTELYGIKNSKKILSPVKAIGSHSRTPMRDTPPPPSVASSSMEIMGPPQRPLTPRPSSSVKTVPTSVRPVNSSEHQSTPRSPLPVRSSSKFSNGQNNSHHGGAQTTPPREFLDSSPAISPSSTGRFLH
ncbi:uncharacterized protein LAJ45_07541 [Morchella importuna]|uniref:uncharacterized protein n=1 Tax=Morchella importuna TaxID=1174673 RepID=UPI001E8DAEB9|nr:uncharacterized protein LAJ45_07541 [Morchella importuna]KAH8148439.1 hypothetical protein LAJ45_07541 [Morchella importuna]